MARSRSPGKRKKERERGVRDRERDRDRYKKHRSRSRERRKRRSKSRSRSPSPPTSALAGWLSKNKYESEDLSEDIAEQEASGSFNYAKLNKAAKSWIEEQIEERVNLKSEQIERTFNERFIVQKTELEKLLRVQVEAELQQEIAKIKKEAAKEKSKYEAMNKELAQRLNEVEEKERTNTQERLEMINERSALQKERLALQERLNELQKKQQNAILNPGGASRAPIKLSFGK